MSFPGAFQLGIFLHCIFIISWLIQLYPYCFYFQIFLQSFNHAVCWLCSFLKLEMSLENMMLSSEFRIILSPCFSPFSSLCLCLCFLYLLSFIFAISLGFNSSITILIPFFFTQFSIQFLDLSFSFPLSFSSFFFFESAYIPSQVRNIAFNSSFPTWFFFLLFCLFSLQLLSQPKGLLPWQVCLFEFIPFVSVCFLSLIHFLS